MALAMEEGMKASAKTEKKKKKSGVYRGRRAENILLSQGAGH